MFCTVYPIWWGPVDHGYVAGRMRNKCSFRCCLGQVTDTLLHIVVVIFIDDIYIYIIYANASPMECLGVLRDVIIVVIINRLDVVMRNLSHPDPDHILLSAHQQL